MNKTDVTTEADIRTRIENLESGGAIVEGLHGRPFGGRKLLQVITLIVRENKESDKVEPIQGGIISDEEFERVMEWHEERWAKRMKDKKWRRWARRHQLPAEIKPKK